MKRSNYMTGAEEEIPQADAFLDEIEAVCRKYGLSISHEDGHGAFKIEPLHEVNIKWLRDAAWNPEPR